MDTLYALELPLLPIGNVLIIREALEELKKSETGLPQWKHELIDEALHQMEQVYEKPEMTAAELEAEVEKEKEYWTKEGDSFLGAQMAAGKRIELRFWNKITGEGI